jgi:hypothetical protein
VRNPTGQQADALQLLSLLQALLGVFLLADVAHNRDGAYDPAGGVAHGRGRGFEGPIRGRLFHADDGLARQRPVSGTPTRRGGKLKLLQDCRDSHSGGIEPENGRCRRIGANGNARRVAHENGIHLRDEDGIQ